ncbi:MAG: hypothetical protein ACK58T_04630, partial [Phycisphaerae bacterium]
ARAAPPRGPQRSRDPGELSPTQRQRHDAAALSFAFATSRRACCSAAAVDTAAAPTPTRRERPAAPVVGPPRVDGRRGDARWPPTGPVPAGPSLLRSALIAEAATPFAHRRHRQSRRQHQGRRGDWLEHPRR